MSRSMPYSFRDERRANLAMRANASAITNTHRYYYRPPSTGVDEMSQPCLLHQSMVMRTPFLSERPFSTIIGAAGTPVYGVGGNGTMTVVPITRSQNKLHKLRSLDSVDVSLTGSSAKSAKMRSGHMVNDIAGGNSYSRKSASDCAGRCLLCLIINAVFIFGIFIAFLVGHWASSSFVDESLYNLNNTLTNKTSYGTTDGLAVKEVIVDGSALDKQREQYLLHTEIGRDHGMSASESNKGTKMTIVDVYPPSLEDDYIFNDRSAFNMRLHRFSEAGVLSGSDSLQTRLAAGKRLTNVPLPKSVLPTHYDLQLDFTSFETREYIAGNASIYLRSFGNATSMELVFHAAANIFISRIRIHRSYSEFVGIKSVKRDLQHELVRIALMESLKVNKEYKVEIEFRTKICQSDGEGTYCFRATLLDRDNRTFVPRITGFVTRFEPRFARTFLPCWDEPRVKTTFNVSIVHASHYTMVLSNTASISQRPAGRDHALFISVDDDEDENENGEIRPARVVRTLFETTPQMSIYLLAFAIGNYTPLEVRTSAANMPLTIWTEPENIVAVHFAANFSPVLFERVQADFGVKYSIGKLDFVVVPNFAVGGMENWGLIIFHARYILSTWAGVRSSPVSSTSSDSGRIQNNMAVDRASEEYKIKKIITHEIVHQWFGNLVTMYDWEELWLKEGFTSYFVFDLLNEAHPQLTEYEYYQNLIHLFQKQSSVAPQALVSKSSSLPAHARHNFDLFDSVALYTKGAVVVKMLKDLVGTVEFHTGVTRFLRKFAFQSVDEHSLWSCLPLRVDHGAEQERLADVMYSWLYNDGVPEIIINRNYEDQSIRVTQQPANLNRYAIFLNDRIPQAKSSRRDKRNVLDNSGAEDWIRPQQQLDESISEESIDLSTPNVIDALLSSLMDYDEKTTRDSAEKKNHALGDNCAPKSSASNGGLKQKRSCITVENQFVGRSMPTTRLPVNATQKTVELSSSTEERLVERIVSTTTTTTTPHSTKIQHKIGKQQKAQEQRQQNQKNKVTFAYDDTRTTVVVELHFGNNSVTVQPLAHSVPTTQTTKNDFNDTDVQPTFDDALFSTPHPLTRVRGSIRKRLKNKWRKPWTRSRYSGRHETEENETDASRIISTDKPVVTSPLSSQTTSVDLSRVPIFSSDVRGLNKGRLGLIDELSQLSDGGTALPSQWEGNAARRLASLQTFGLMSRNDYDSEGADKTARLNRARSSATTRRPISVNNKQKQYAIWWIPFSYAFGSARSSAGQTVISFKVRQFWLRNQTVRFVDVGLSARQYLLANPHWIYPYRVNYDLDNWQMLIEQLRMNHVEIPVMSRAQLLVDGEAYLRYSAAPHLYIRLLSYLSKETELGVLLIGLDALHSLLDAFSGTRVAGALTVQLLPVVQQLDRQLAATVAGGMPPEKAALWLLGPLRLAKLYQLRCLCNLGTCSENHQVSKWLAHPTALDAEHHQQITAICHFLFTQAGASELTLLAGLLRQRSTQWSVLIQLASCVRDDTLIRTAVEQILRTRNAVVYLSALKSGYSVQYNRRFRELFWSGVRRLSLHERQFLFAVNTGRSDRIARQLLHSVRTVSELTQVEDLLPEWPALLRANLDYLRRKLGWLNGRAAEQLHTFIVENKHPDIMT